jgi:shikimate kinase
MANLPNSDSTGSSTLVQSSLPAATTLDGSSGKLEEPVAAAVVLKRKSRKMKFFESLVLASLSYRSGLTLLVTMSFRKGRFLTPKRIEIALKSIL